MSEPKPLPFTPIPPDRVREHKIYVIVNTKNGRMYVGRTCGSMTARWQGHRAHARVGKPGAFFDAIRESGLEAFETHVVEDGLTNDEASDRETWWITHLGTHLAGGIGYNSALRGTTRESRKRLPAGRRFIDTPYGRRPTNARPVRQLDLAGNHIADFESAAAAARAVGCSEPGIRIACNESKTTVKGFRWMWLEDRPRRTVNFGRPVLQCDARGHAIRRFECIAHAAHDLGMKAQGISNTISGRKKSAGGFRWLYADDPVVPALPSAAPQPNGAFVLVSRTEPVRQLDANGKLIAVHASGVHAAKATGVSKSAICRACKKQSPFAGGFRWEYAEVKGPECRSNEQ